MAEDLTARIASWLTKTGHPFEMRAKRAIDTALSDTGWRVMANMYYDDLETGKSREVDLELHWLNGTRGVDDRLPVSVEFQVLMECKTAAEPWVILRHGPDESRPWVSRERPFLDVGFLSGAVYWSQYQASTKLDQFLIDLSEHLERCLPARQSPGYAVMDAFKERKSDHDNERKSSYDAVRQAVASCINAAATVHLSYSCPATSWYFPVVLTSARLFEATLADDSEGLAVREVDRTSVIVSLSGATACVVTIIRPSALDSLADDLKDIEEVVDKFLESPSSNPITIKEDEPFLLCSSPPQVADHRGAVDDI